MLKITIFITLLLNLSLFPNNDALLKTDYELSIAQAFTALTKRNYFQAGVIAKKTSREFPLRPDAFYILGIIHHQQQLDSLALKFLNKAEKYQKDLINQSNLIEIYALKVKIFKKQAKLKNEIEYLEKITFKTSNLEGTFYQENASVAYFRLGEINFKLENWGKGINFFLKSLKNNYANPLLPYLYLSYYYANFSQQEIQNHFQQYLPSQYQGYFPEKENSFIFYYKFYRFFFAKQDNSFLTNPLFKQMHLKVQMFFRGLK